MIQFQFSILKISVIFVLLIFSLASFSHTDSDRILPLELSQTTLVPFNESLMPWSEQVRRTQKVMAHFQVPNVFPHEDSTESIFSSIRNPKSRLDFQTQLKYFDPQSLLSRFIQISANLIQFHFPNRDNPTYSWNGQLPNSPIPPIRKNSLIGLRIGIDPGHMAGRTWDRLTGKYVRDSQGRELSEGLLNLQVALLLKQKLEARGAIVRLTTSLPQPATNLDYNTFDIKPFARFELRESAHESWFQTLIQANSTDTEMIRRFEQSSQVRYLFSENSRRDYFIKRADLWARSKIMNDFNADIVIVIHFDAASSGGYDSTEPNPQMPNETKAFVFGSYEPGETASLQSLSYLAKRAIHNDDFVNAKSLSRAIVKNMNSQLGLKLDTSSSTNGQLIEPGVRSRNLVVSRYLRASSVTYLETLFYNRPVEFEALLRRDYSMNIGGSTYTYSQRLKKIVDATESGIIDFVTSP